MSYLSGEYSEGQAGKFVVGAKERSSKKVKARVISDRERETLHGFIAENVEIGILIYTDDFHAYRQLANYCQQFVKHGAGEYVNEFSGRCNIRELDTIEQMNHIVRNLEGMRLEYKELVSDRCG